MSKRISVLLLAMGMTFAMACKSELDNKPSATVSEPTEAAPQAASAGAEPEQAVTTRELAIATEQSKIEWLGAKVTGDHPGGFKTWSGKAIVDSSNKIHGLSFDVDATSLYSDNERLEGHLRSPDFFDVENHPKSTFVSTAIADGAEGDATHTVTGNLMMRGVTRQISFPATIRVEGDKVLATTEFTINRTDFGINYKGMADDLIREEVLLKIHLEVPTT
jgi:polyisoprenoid-binding protein YceI